MKRLVLAAALVLTATPAAFAQSAYAPGNGYYNAAPGYAAAPGYGGYYSTAPAYDYYGAPPAWSDNNSERGGPGPRVGAGGGMGIGSQR